MGWIDGVENRGGRLMPVGVEEDGVRREVSLVECKKFFDRMPAGNRVRSAVVDLESLRVGDTREYANAHQIADASDEHLVYQFEVNGVRVVVPAALWICAFVSRVRKVEEALFCAASLGRIAFPKLSATHGISMYFPRGKSTVSSSETVQSRFTWFTCFPSGLSLWDSVFQNALDGRLGFAPPRATALAGFVGVRVDDALYVTRVEIESLEPTEPPLPFARPYAPKKFMLRQNHKVRERIKSLNKSVRHTVRQTDIPMGSAGWATTDDEWLQIRAELKLNGHPFRTSTRTNVDFALEKFGSGKSWEEIAPTGRKNTLQSVYYYWKNAGRWDIVKEVLNRARAR